MIAVSKKDVIRVTLDSDKHLPDHQRTVFHTRPMTVGEVRRFRQDIKLAEGKQEIAFGLDELTGILNRIVTKWENLKDSEGTTIPFNASDENKWDVLTLEQLSEVFQACLRLNELSKDQVKN